MMSLKFQHGSYETTYLNEVKNTYLFINDFFPIFLRLRLFSLTNNRFLSSAPSLPFIFPIITKLSKSKSQRNSHSKYK